MNQRDALIEAHRQAALALRQHAEAGDGLADDEQDSDKIAEAVRDLALRHDRAVQRMTDTGSQPTGGDV